MPSGSAPHVFVVDDEPVIASTLTAILKMHGFSATCFTSPLDVLNAAAAKAPDLLISDVDMPGLSGIDLAIQMKAQHPACKILLFSGRPSTLDLVDAARAKGHDFDLLQKPVLPPELLLAIWKKVGSTSEVCAGGQPAFQTFKGLAVSAVEGHGRAQISRPVRSDVTGVSRHALQ